jgi:hypothetical protein
MDTFAIHSQRNQLAAPESLQIPDMSVTPSRRDDIPLLWVLRNTPNLTGTEFGYYGEPVGLGLAMTRSWASGFRSDLHQPGGLHRRHVPLIECALGTHDRINDAAIELGTDRAKGGTPMSVA